MSGIYTSYYWTTCVEASPEVAAQTGFPYQYFMRECYYPFGAFCIPKEEYLA